MSDVLFASTRVDAEAAEAVIGHHAEMSGRMAAYVERLATARDAGTAQATRDALVQWAREELLPHARSEEETLYVAAAEIPELRTLVSAMLQEHQRIGELVDVLERAAQPGGAVAAAGALEAVFDVHLHKENELVIPALVASPDHSLTELVSGIHEILGGHEHGDADSHEHSHEQEPASGGCGGGCTCGEVDGPGFPELDARQVPHAIRHATIFGALEAVTPGGGLVLVAPHDPLPLLAQVEQRTPGLFEVSYLERGPEAWRLQFSRS